MIRPWMKFYTGDWRADPRLRSCSLAARGLWMEMLCVMHEAEPRGSLLINGLPVSGKQLAMLVGVSLKDAVALLGELAGAGVFSREEGGIIYSRRMRRDSNRSAEGREHILKRRPYRSPYRSPSTEDEEKNDAGPSAGPSTQKLEARSQKEEIGGDAPARETKSQISPEAHKLADGCLSAIGVDPQNPPQGWFGLEYQAQIMIAAGYDHDRTVATFARIGPNKPMTYHLKAAETAHVEASNKPTIQPGERRHGAGKSVLGYVETLIQNDDDCASDQGAVRRLSAR